MKIRTDFVTNSSSSSFVAIKINSREMAKLFEKHRDVLEDFLSPDTIEFFGEFGITEDTISLEGGIPESDFGKYMPKDISELISKLAALLTFREVEAKEHIGDGEYNEEFDELLTELFEREAELIDSVERIDWTFGYEEHGEEGDGESEKIFSYTK